jgi:hypothetical protein
MCGVGKAQDDARWREVSPLDLPGPVLRALRTCYPKEDLGPVFVGEGALDGRFRAVVRFGSGERIQADLDADGTILGGRDLAADVPVKELPDPVAQVLRARYPQARFVFAQSTRWGDEGALEVLLRQDSRRFLVTFRPDGKVVRVETDVKPPDLPRTVGRGLREAQPEATVLRAAQVTEGDKLVGYVVVVRPADSVLAQAVRLDPDGKLLSTAPVVPPGKGPGDR